MRKLRLNQLTDTADGHFLAPYLPGEYLCAGARVLLATGDVLIVEPGEDHHLISDGADPCINLWLHAGPQRNPVQLVQP